MQTVVAEQPLTMAILLGVVAGLALYGWLQTGKRAAMIVAVVCLALIPVAWSISERWVTDREQIRAAIERTVQAVKQNDIDQAIEVISPRRPDLMASARRELARFDFSEARVNKFRSIELVRGSEPPEAEVELSATAVVSDARGRINNQRVLRRIVLLFQKAEDGRWYVHDYNHTPITGQPDMFSPQHGRSR